MEVNTKIVVGQCWMSRAEPELGLGFVSHVESRMLSIYFPESDTTRTYGVSVAPIQRVNFKAGDKICRNDGKKFEVQSSKLVDGLWLYESEGQKIFESQLSGRMNFSRPEERLLNGQVDPLSTFYLRERALSLREKIDSSEMRGFLGPRISLIPHQIFVANEVAHRALPRVLLADEVGLGKTIEAGLILHHHIVTGQAQRVLIVVPKSLGHQWFVEMYRKFNLAFSVLSKEEEFSEEIDTPLDDKQLHIIDVDLLSHFEPAKEAVLKSEWDMVIVDEAHRLTWSPQYSSPEFQAVEALARLSKSLILLTATPEQLGLEGHYARLNLLDPDRFSSYQDFLKETQEYRSVAELAKCLESDQLTEATKGKIGELLGRTLTLEEFSSKRGSLLARELTDRFGTGRILFRNARSSISADQVCFPQRKLISYPLAKSLKETPHHEKAEWLTEFLKEKPQQKFLLICHSNEKVTHLYQLLRENSSLKVGTFHGQLSLMERDRNAAYFADPEGARVLLCSEIGSEGRNFQFSQDLILFDLPKSPDLLEQRIGRLDRIGQKNEIFIHVPFLQGTEEEVWFRWYHEGLNAFCSQVKAGPRMLSDCQQTLHQLSESFDGQENSRIELEKFLISSEEKAQIYKAELERGRDRLLEINSYDQYVSQSLLEKIQTEEKSENLQKFMSDFFAYVGIDEEELGGRVRYIKPGESMYVSTFPGLPSEGMQLTYDRHIALKREEITFMSWDHPMVIAALDYLLGQEYGNCALARWIERPDSGIPALEAFFTVEIVAPRDLYASQYFPTHTIRVVLDSKGQDLSVEWPHEKLQKRIRVANKPQIHAVKGLPRKHLDALLDQARQVAKQEIGSYVSRQQCFMRKRLEEELDRLRYLKEKNNLIRDEEISFLEMKQRKLIEVSSQASLRLDAFQMILP